MDLRLWLSLAWRMAAAVTVLSSLLVVLAGLAAAVGAIFIGLLLPGVVAWGTEWVLRAPRLSSMLGVSSAVIAAAAFLELWVVFTRWSAVSRHTSDPYLFPPSDPVQVAIAIITLGSLYASIVETVATLAVIATDVVGMLWLLVGGVLLGVLVALVTFVSTVRDTIQSLQTKTVETETRAAEVEADVAGIVGRLARHANVPAPRVRATDRDRPEAFTVGAGSNAMLVVSTGLMSVLSDDEVEAVLAHEVSHLANGDSRIMSYALTPVIIAERWNGDRPDDIDLFGWFWWYVEIALLRYGQLGVAVLSRGREWAADAGAVSLTGSPAALASALLALDDERGLPREDLRQRSDAFAVLDVLPMLSPDAHAWPFRTHPSTADRVARLQRLAAELERK